MDDNINLPLDMDDALSFEPRSSTSGAGSKRSRARRSSILKVPRGGPLQDLGNTEIVMTSRRRSLKRVSFSAAKQVKEFKKFDTESQTFTVWNQSYEEEQSRGDGVNTSSETTVNDQEQLRRGSAEALAPLNVEIPLISINVDSPPNSFVPILDGGSDFVQMLTRKENLQSMRDGDLQMSTVDMHLTKADGFPFEEGSNSPVDMELTETVPYSLSGGNSFSMHKSRGEWQSATDMELTGIVPMNSEKTKAVPQRSFPQDHADARPVASDLSVEIPLRSVNVDSPSYSCAPNLYEGSDFVQMLTRKENLQSRRDGDLQLKTVDMDLTKADAFTSDKGINSSVDMELTDYVPYSQSGDNCISMHKSRGKWQSATEDMELTEIVPMNLEKTKAVLQESLPKEDQKANVKHLASDLSVEIPHTSINVDSSSSSRAPILNEESDFVQMLSMRDRDLQLKSVDMNLTKVDDFHSDKGFNSSVDMELTKTVPYSLSGGNSAVMHKPSEWQSATDMDLTRVAPMNPMSSAEEEPQAAEQLADFDSNTGRKPSEWQSTTDMDLTRVAPMNSTTAAEEERRAAEQSADLDINTVQEISVMLRESLPCENHTDVGPLASDTSADKSRAFNISIDVDESCSAPPFNEEEFQDVTESAPREGLNNVDQSCPAPVFNEEEERDVTTESAPRESLNDVDQSCSASTDNEEEARDAVTESAPRESLNISVQSAPETIAKEWQRAVFEEWCEEVKTSPSDDPSMHHGRWELEELSDWKCNVTFLHNSLVLNISLGLLLPEEHTESGVVVKHRSISSIGFQNPSPLQLRPRGDQFMKLAHRILLREWPSQRLESLCKNTKQLTGLLAQLSSSVRDAAEFVLALVDIAGSHCLCQVSDLKVTVGFVSTLLEMAFTVTVSYSCGLSKTREMGAQVNAVKGVDANKIQELLASCGDGWSFIKSLVSHVDTYIKMREAEKLQVSV